MRILTVVGARPQFVKAAVVSREIAARRERGINIREDGDWVAGSVAALDAIPDPVLDAYLWVVGRGGPPPDRRPGMLGRVLGGLRRLRGGVQARMLFPDNEAVWSGVHSSSDRCSID